MALPCVTSHLETIKVVFFPPRVNGVVSNMAQFAKAFDCPVGSKMNPGPEHRCRVW